MALLDRIQIDMVAAMRSKEEMKLNAIRMIKAALKKHEVDSMKPLDRSHRAANTGDVDQATPRGR